MTRTQVGIAPKTSPTNLTVENLARYRAYREATQRTKYTGHLGVPGQHEAPAQ